VITSLAHTTDDTSVLNDMYDKLQVLEKPFRDLLPTIGGLVVRSTSLSGRTRHIKQKYSRLFSQAKWYSSLNLIVQHKQGRKKQDWWYRNCVGSKSDWLRKVRLISDKLIRLYIYLVKGVQLV